MDGGSMQTSTPGDVAGPPSTLPHPVAVAVAVPESPGASTTSDTPTCSYAAMPAPVPRLPRRGTGHLTILMHKPALCLTSTCDGMKQAKRSQLLRRQRSLGTVGETRATVVDVLRANGIEPSAVSAVGRLDYETSGLLLCTSDGTMNNRIRAKVTVVVKVYELDVAGNVGAAADAVTRLREPLEYSPTSRTDPAHIEWLSARELNPAEAAVDPWPWPPHAGWVTCLRVTIAEGKNQQIRKLCKRSNLHVRRLHRVSLGPQRLGDLAAGRCRVLDAAEVDALYAACAMDGL